MNKFNFKNKTRLVVVVFALTLLLACFAACDQGNKKGEDFVPQLTLDMTSSTAKAEVTVKNYVDGDTTHFWAPTSVSETGVVKARYLAINTPESTGRIEEYGKAASRFTKEKLKSAVSIIIESDDENWNHDSNGRHLVWVWYKPAAGEAYRNLNLEILQEGLAIASNTAQSRYGDICVKALEQAETLKLNCFSGQKDPDMYYGEVQNVSLKELRGNLEAYAGITVAFEGNVVADSNGSIYVEDYDAETGMYFGITAYYGTAGLTGSGKEIIAVGNRARIVGSLQYYETADIWQISGLKYDLRDRDNPENLVKIGEGYEAAYTVVTPDTFTGKVTITTKKGGITEYEYAFATLNTSIAMNGLKVVSSYTTTAESSSSVGAFTLNCEAADGTKIVIRTTVLRDENNEIVKADKYVGKTINVRGFVDIYENEYQIKVFKESNITIVG